MPKEKYKPTTREKELEKVIKDIFYMARRYAHGRHTYSPDIVRGAYNTLKANGINIKSDRVIDEPLEETRLGYRSDYLDDIN